MSEMLKIGGICGSLRKDSLNKKLLLASQHLCPSTATIEILDISNLPLFNQDHENNVIKEVVEFKEKVRKMDGILFVSPEYNYRFFYFFSFSFPFESNNLSQKKKKKKKKKSSISSPLKNAIDWASRPYGDSAWNRKPVAIQGTTIGFDFFFFFFQNI